MGEAQGEGASSGTSLSIELARLSRTRVRTEEEDELRICATASSTSFSAVQLVIASRGGGGDHFDAGDDAFCWNPRLSYRFPTMVENVSGADFGAKTKPRELGNLTEHKKIPASAR